MGQEGVYFDLVNWLDQQEQFEPSTFLQKLQASYQTGAVIYVDGVIGSERLKLNRLVHSRPSDAKRTARLLMERPLRDHSCTSFPKSNRFKSIWQPYQRHMQAAGFSLGDNTRIGVGYPLLSHPGRRACLLVQAEDEKDRWGDCVA